MDARNVVRRILKELAINIIFILTSCLILFISHYLFSYCLVSINKKVYPEIYNEPPNFKEDIAYRYSMRNRVRQKSSSSLQDVQKWFDAVNEHLRQYSAARPTNPAEMDWTPYIDSYWKKLVHYGECRFDKQFQWKNLQYNPAEDYEKIFDFRVSHLKEEAYLISGILFLICISSILIRYGIILYNWLNYKKSDNWWLN